MRVILSVWSKQPSWPGPVVPIPYKHRVQCHRPSPVTLHPLPVSVFAPITPIPWIRFLRGRQGSPRPLRRAVLEGVLESPRDGAQVSHAAGADGLSPLRLLTPVDCAPSPSVSACLVTTFPWRDDISQIGLGTYTCGPWQRGIRTRSRYASGRASSGGLARVDESVSPRSSLVPYH